MRRRWRFAGLGLAALVAGCQEPTQIVPVGPPGVEFVRMPPVPADGGAQALGEQAVQASAAGTSTGGSREAPPAAIADAPMAPSTKVGEAVTTENKLGYETLKEGSGDPVKAGQTAVVHYVGTLTDGKKFDSSRDNGQPFEVVLGAGRVIKGWDQGIPGMKVGEVRRLTVPPELGYGPRGMPPVIPPDATLVFEVELLGVK